MTSRRERARATCRPGIVSFLAVAVILTAFAGRARATPAAGEAAPALVIVEIGGVRFDLAALRDKVVVLNFWATWCAPCRLEMPQLDAFYARFHALGVEVVGISVDRVRERRDVADTARAVRYPVAILADATADGFGKPAVLPVTFVIDRRGVVRAVITPNTAVDVGKALEQAITPLLQEGLSAP